MAMDAQTLCGRAAAHGGSTPFRGRAIDEPGRQNYELLFWNSLPR